MRKISDSSPMLLIPRTAFLTSPHPRGKLHHQFRGRIPMAQETSHFACPACGGKKAWKPQLAGKRAKCSCRQVITVPAQAPGQPEAVTPSAPDPPPSAVPARLEEPFTEASVASA